MTVLANIAALRAQITAKKENWELSIADIQDFIDTVENEYTTDIAAASGVLEKSADVTISSAELLALNATPITLVAAPGANKILVPLLYVFFLDYNSAAYAGIAVGEDLVVRYTDENGGAMARVDATGFLDSTADKYRVAYPADATPVGRVELAPAINAPLVLHMATGEITTGDSPLVVRTYYKEIDLTELVAA